MPTSELPDRTLRWGGMLPLVRASGEFMRVAIVPGQSASNGMSLPVVVVGHEDMDEAQWTAFVVKHSAQMWPEATAVRMAKDGFDVGQMLPTTLFGQALRENSHGCFPRTAAVLVESICAIGKWPDAVLQLKQDFGSGSPVTAGQLIRAIRMLPDPTLPSARTYRTLGDMLEPGMNVKRLGR